MKDRFIRADVGVSKQVSTKFSNEKGSHEICTVQGKKCALKKLDT